MYSQINAPHTLRLEPEPHPVCVRPYPLDKYVQRIYVPVISGHLQMDLVCIFKKETERMTSSYMM